MRKILKIFIISIISFLVLLATLMVFLKFYFPSDLVRKELQSILSKELNGDVKINSLSIDPFGSILVNDLTVNTGKERIVQLKLLEMKYSFSELLNRKFVVNKVLLDNADISINMAELSSSKTPEEDAKKPGFLASSSLLLLPLSISLNSLLINHTNFKIELNESQQVSFMDINIAISGEMPGNQANLDGKVEIGNVIIQMENKKLEFPLGIDFDLSADILKQEAIIKKIAFHSGSSLKMSLSGIVKNFLSNREFDLSLSDSNINIGDLLTIAKEFIPPDLQVQKAGVSGTLSPQIEIKGTMSEFNFAGSVKTNLLVKNISPTLSQESQKDTVIKISDMSVSLETDLKGEFTENKGLINLTGENSVSGKIRNIFYKDNEISALLEDVEVFVDAQGDVLKGDYRINKFKVKAGDIFKLLMKADYHEATKSFSVNAEIPFIDIEKLAKSISGPIMKDIQSYKPKGKLSMSVKASGEDLGKIDMEKLVIPLSLDLNLKMNDGGGIYNGNSLSGVGGEAVFSYNPVKNEVLMKKMNVGIKNMFEVKSSAKIQQAIGKSGKRSFTVNVGFKGRMDKILKFVPTELLNGFDINPDSKEDVVGLKFSGILGSDYHPIKANLSGDAKIGKIKVGSKNPLFGVALNSLDLKFNSDYAAKRGKVNGKVNGKIWGKVSFANLKQGNDLKIGNMDISFGTDFKAEMTKKMKLKKLSGENIVSLKLENILYKDKNIKALFREVNVLVEGWQDVFKGDYHIKKLEVKAGDIFNLAMKADYHKDKKSFSVDAKIPSLNIKKLAEVMSGPAMKDVKEIKPEGELSISIHSSGKVPEKVEPKKANIDKFKIPFAFDVNLLMKNVGGSFNGNGLKGTTGSLLLSYDPEKQDRIIFKNDLKADEVYLSAEFPLQKISNASLFIDTSAIDFNEVKIKKIDFGMDGAGISLTGNMTGLQHALPISEMNVSKFVENLYVDLNSKITLDPGRFKKLMKKYGLSFGSGKSKLTIKALKKENGVINIYSELDNRKLNFNYDGLKVVNLDSSIPMNKRLDHVIKQKSTTSKSATPKSKPSKSKPSKTSGFSPANAISPLKGLSQSSKSTKIETLDLGFFKIHNLSSIIGFDGSNFKIQNIAMDLLDGGMGGDVTFKFGEVFGISAHIQAAGINLNKMFPDNARISGDAKMDGIVDIDINFKDKNGKVDFEKMDASLRITKIGKEALDRILFLADPKESNPAIIYARSKLKTANPSRVNIELSRGMMNLEVKFQQKLLPVLKIKRIPIALITNLKTLNKMLEPLNEIAHIIELVAAKSYGVDENGKLYIK